MYAWLKTLDYEDLGHIRFGGCNLRENSTPQTDRDQTQLRDFPDFGGYGKPTNLPSWPPRAKGDGHLLCEAPVVSLAAKGARHLFSRVLVVFCGPMAIAML